MVRRLSGEVWRPLLCRETARWPALRSSQCIQCKSLVHDEAPAPGCEIKAAFSASQREAAAGCVLQTGFCVSQGEGWRSWETQSDLLTQAFLAQMLRLRAGLWMAGLLHSYQLNAFLFQFLLIFIFAAIYLNAVFYLKDVLKMLVGKERAYSGIK